MVQQYFNAQNIGIYGLSFKDISEHLTLMQRFQNTSSVMVWAGISHSEKLPLPFIGKGVKTNVAFYQLNILEGELKPGADGLYGDGIFQQDSAPAHKVKINQD